MAFGTFLYTYFFLQESLLSAIKRNTEVKRASSPMQCEGPDATAPILSSGESNVCYGTLESLIENHVSPADLHPPPFRALLTRQLLVALMSIGFIAFIDQGFGVLLPLMLSTSIPLGGLGFDPYTIGMTMGTWGLLNAGFQVFAFPKLFHRLGPRNLCVMCFGCSIVTFLAFPLMNIFAKQTGMVDYRVWGVLILQLFSFSFVFMTYSMWNSCLTSTSILRSNESFMPGCTQLFVMDVAPGRASIGAVNGLSQMTSSIVRTLAPTFTSSSFSLSVQKQLIGGYLVYAMLVVISLSSVVIATLLPSHLHN
ncbi:hypothetical protein C0995_008008 [Termitomyces sp. Mi166|nr:hypothetical protein C0995_008008 [Termitomyces sp. Mi166\